MIDLVRRVFAEDVPVESEIDLDGDDYGDNELAASEYAVVLSRTEWWDGSSGEPWVTLHTSQGSFEMPANHLIKVKVDD